MLRYPCLVLDHDDTVVDSEASVNYPCFLLSMKHFRPGTHMDPITFSRWCFDPGFEALLRQYYGFTDQELEEEFQQWKDYSASHIPAPCPGIREIILRQKALGGKICVVSHSSRQNIRRDYQTHFGMEPDLIFSWEDPAPQRKPNPYPLNKIMETFHLSPAQLLMVDDLKPGADMARQAGVEAAYAGWSHRDVPEISRRMEALCDYSFPDTQKFYRFLFEDTVSTP